MYLKVVQKNHPNKTTFHDIRQHLKDEYYHQFANSVMKLSLIYIWTDERFNKLFSTTIIFLQNSQGYTFEILYYNYSIFIFYK